VNTAPVGTAYRPLPPLAIFFQLERLLQHPYYIDFTHALLVEKLSSKVTTATLQGLESKKKQYLGSAIEIAKQLRLFFFYVHVLRQKKTLRLAAFIFGMNIAEGVDSLRACFKKVYGNCALDINT
jgi:hypothetical protein